MKKKLNSRHRVSSKKNDLKKEIVSHVKEDVRDFKKEIFRDKSLLKRVDKPKKHHVSRKKDPKTRTKTEKRDKVKFVMEEFKEGKLHSGSKKGPMVTNPRQAIAIAISESKKKGRKRK